MPTLTAHAATASVQLRTDQAGYLPGGTKIAYLMADAALSGESYQVLDSAGNKAARSASLAFTTLAELVALSR